MQSVLRILKHWFSKGDILLAEMQTGEVSRKGDCALPCAQELDGLCLGVKQSIDWRFTPQGEVTLRDSEGHTLGGDKVFTTSAKLRTRRTSQGTYTTYRVTGE